MSSEPRNFISPAIEDLTKKNRTKPIKAMMLKVLFMIDHLPRISFLAICGG